MRKIVLSLLLTLGLAVTASAQSSNMLLNAAGATFPYPMYSKWFDVYHTVHPNIQINYQSIGSGGGIRQVLAGTVDFGASDGPMTDDQIKEFKDKRGVDILHFPTVMGADVPTYNIPGVTAELNFTQKAISGIYLGTITKWNDPEIAKANPGVSSRPTTSSSFTAPTAAAPLISGPIFCRRPAMTGRIKLAKARPSTGQWVSAARATKVLLAW